MRTILAAVLAVLTLPVALAQAPPVGEQSISIETGSHAAPIPTETDVEIPYTITYTIGVPQAGAARVLVLVDAPAGWLVVADPSEHATPDAPAIPATYTFEGVLRARHDGTPRAFRADTIRVVASAQGDGKTVEPREGRAELALAADWRPGLRVVVQSPNVALSPSGVIGLATGEIQNTGNAPVDVAASVRTAPEGCAATIDEGPGLIEPGARATLAIDVTCDPVPDAAQLVLRVTHALAGDPARTGEPVEPVWEIGARVAATGPRVFGDEPARERYDASWGAVVLAPLGLAIAALVRRRA